MAEFFYAIALPLCAGLCGSLLLDLASSGGFSAWRRRPGQWVLIHIALLTLGFCAELLVFQRPWFAASQMLVLHGVVLAVGAIKMGTMHEPFVFQDFEYFIDMLRHPRLYLPFFGAGKLLTIACAVGVLIYGSTRLESNLAGQLGWLPFLEGWLLLTGTALLLLWLTTRRALPATFAAQDDLAVLGLAASMAAYAVAEKAPMHLPSRFAGLPPLPDPLPNLIAVQSESFFDARRLWSHIHPDVYGWLDTARAAAWQQGQLRVPAIGANTVRTEFAFLSGLDDAALGVHRFNPYRRLPQLGVHTLAQHLRHAGYRTVCVHPYVAGFYRRDQVFPRFGFDEFIDVRAFSKVDHAGPFVGDVAVAERVAALLGERRTPLFVFVITMENHGPLHLERVSAEEQSALFTVPPPDHCNELGVYLRHIKNAGRMLLRLQAALAAADRPGALCWYGDHVPIMPKVFAHTGFADTDADTDYFIWRTQPPPHTAGGLTLPTSELARRFVECAGWRGGDAGLTNRPAESP